MRLPIFISTLLLITVLQLSAQVHSMCGTDEVEEMLKATQATYSLDQIAYEKAYQQYLKKATTTANSRNAMPFVFPVVVHVIHDCAVIGTTANPDDLTIQQVLDKTTKRFRHSHEDAQTYTNPRYGADTAIEFCLAKVDPEGRYTNGIVRWQQSRFPHYQYFLFLGWSVST